MFLYSVGFIVTLQYPSKEILTASNPSSKYITDFECNITKAALSYSSSLYTKFVRFLEFKFSKNYTKLNPFSKFTQSESRYS